MYIEFEGVAYPPTRLFSFSATHLIATRNDEKTLRLCANWIDDRQFQKRGFG